MSELCLGCMKEYENGSVCPFCGFSNDSTDQALPFIPLGTVIRGRYIVGRLISSTSQGAKYLCFDDELKSPAVLREFLPEGICGRGRSGGTKVLVRSQYTELYDKLLNSFMNYFRTVARLRELVCMPAIYDIFNENNTGYTIEDYENLISFREYVTRLGGKMEWNEVRPLFMPLISSLDVMNKNGIRHLGLSPDNIFVNEGGKLVLGGFMIPQLRTNNKSIKPSYIPGCSAPEQYIENGIIDEKTDVYSLTAVLFFALTGSLPDPYEKRRFDNRLMINTNIVKQLPPHIVSAMANGLQFSRSRRCSSFEELKVLLTSAPTVRAMRNEIKAETQVKGAQLNNSKKTNAKKGMPAIMFGILSCIVAGIIFSFFANMLLDKDMFAGLFSSEGEVSVSDTDSLSAVIDITNENSEKHFSVPDFSKMTYEDLIKDDESHSEYNIVFTAERKYDDKIPKDTVVSQSPDPKTELEYGSLITVTLSNGPQEVILPEIKDKSINDVAKLFAEESLVVYVDRQFDDTIKEGNVIGYNGYYAGNAVKSESSITIIVSKGPLDSEDSE